MKNIFTFLFFIIASFVFGFSEPTIKDSIFFKENKGQVSDQDYKPRPDVLFSGSTKGMVYHLKKDGISYQLYKVESWKEEEDDRYNGILKENNNNEKVSRHLFSISFRC